MMPTVKQVHTHPIYGFRFVEVVGYGGHDHASAWTFQDEQIVRDRWWHSINPGDTVLDVGAAFGSYALPALIQGARVVCFSPADLDTMLLSANLTLNEELARRCLVVRDGLYSRDGWFQPDICDFVANHDDTDRLTPPTAPTDKGWLLVRSLDSFLAERPGIDRVDWIKMDVEGAELEVLRGAEKCLREWRPKILAELHLFHDGMTTRRVFDFLMGLGVGYQMHGPVQHGAVEHALFQVGT